MGHFPWLCSITRGYYTYIDVHSPLCHHFRFQSQQRLLFPIAERVSESNSAPLQSVHCSMPGIREFVLPPAAPWRRFRAKLKKKRSPGCDEPKSSPYNSIYYNILHACIYIYTHTTHTHTYIYIYICVCMSLCLFSKHKRDMDMGQNQWQPKLAGLPSINPVILMWTTVCWGFPNSSKIRQL